jgi:hypothetical protein
MMRCEFSSQIQHKPTDKATIIRAGGHATTKLTSEDGGFTAECRIVCGQTGEESNVDGSADYLSEDNITRP